MTKIATVAVLGITLLLGACAGVNPTNVGGGSSVIITPTGNADIDAVVVKAQDLAVRVCGFLPAASTVSNIIATFVPGAAPINSIATQIAQGICSAVTKKGFRRGSSAPTFRGVAITGQRVR